MWFELWISLKEKYAEFIDLSWKFGGVLSPRNVKELVCLRDYFHLYIHLLFLRMHPQCLLTKTHFICYCYEGIEVNLLINCEKKNFCALFDGWHRVVAPKVHFLFSKAEDVEIETVFIRRLGNVCVSLAEIYNFIASGLTAVKLVSIPFSIQAGRFPLLNP